MISTFSQETLDIIPRSYLPDLTRSMARGPKKTTPEKKPIEQYEHKGKKRLNNPPVGLVTPETDREEPKKTYSYDPHLDPQLIWASKKDHNSFEVPSVSLHV